ncbi:MAG: Hsp20/alpha crystallin family protein [Desulfopila sp.]|jgi:HSP20 family molecular chaperone IbpA|nr:Hsp20/alpha crystallin family protein [Desulfopila sp.]
MALEKIFCKINGALVNFRGEKHTTKCPGATIYVGSEQIYKIFAVTLHLPAEVVEHQMNTSYDNSILKILYPKKWYRWSR